MKAEYIDHMGSDLRVANAARVSFNKESDWEYVDYAPDSIEYGIDSYGTQRLSKKDERLINYLASHGHWTPFAHCVVTLREQVPIFVARQRFKHTVGFAYNEVSRRYVDDPPEFYEPEIWRGRAENKKQGSSGVIGNKKTAFNTLNLDGYADRIYYSEYISFCQTYYQSLLDHGVAPEQARMVLPQSMYTSYYVTGSLAAWARAYNLRSKPDAQMEIQELANQWDQIISKLFPISWSTLVHAGENVPLPVQ